MTCQRWECPDRDRYYEAHLARDLLGDWVLTRVWGRRGSPHGRITHTPFKTLEQAQASLRRLATRRRARGYLPT